MQPVPFLLVLAVALMAGCTGLPGPPTSTSTGPDLRDGVVILNEQFRATQAQAATFAVDIPAGAQRLQYEVTEDPGLVPNLRISLTGCGEATLPGSSARQNGTLCQVPRSGAQTLRVEISNLAVGSGRILLRADIP